ncbi:NCS2 family permease [Clostridium sp. C105KSO13]|uniref:NCS2 family permease n=1 Tax=Clostridium sp. C105KSO13 TaxID=1776045 RepID=UPI0007405C68|nr:NCS2 family permease [Clostridium sp. C105KSO13]CUX48420.1 Putative permease YicO [Clostridium sp. C105KSO13]
MSMKSFFKLEEKKTNVKTEVIAGVTTFMTMAYVLAVQPSAIVGFSGDTYTDINGIVITKEAIMVTCAVVSAIITLFMGLYANLPFALATGMGTNFMFGGLIQSNTLSFGAVMATTLISGVIFVILTIFGVRDLIVKAIPKNIKTGIGTAIGFYITYLGFKNSGIGSFENGISFGNLRDPAVLLAILGLFLIAILTAYKVNGAILIGIVTVTIIGIPLGVTTIPETFAKVPDFAGLSNIMFEFDFISLLTFQTIVYVFIAFCGDFFSTLGTVLGVGGKAGMLDENGNMPEIQKPFLVDAIGTCVSAFTGNTTITTFVESTAGVEAGGRSGLTSVVVSVLFGIMVLFSPLVLMIPNAATGPALIFVGLLMINGIQSIDFSDFTELFGTFIMIVFVIFTGGIASGIAAGILAHIVIKLATGKWKELHPVMYVLAIPLVMYFIFM